MGQKRRPGGGFGALSRGRWLSRHGAGCPSCQLTSICVVDPSRRSVVRSHRRAMSCQISSTQVVDASRGSVVRSHRRAMSCQISSIFSTRLVDPSRTSVVRSHSKVMHGPCRPPQQVSAYGVLPPPAEPPDQVHARVHGGGRCRTDSLVRTPGWRPSLSGTCHCGCTSRVGEGWAVASALSKYWSETCIMQFFARSSRYCSDSS